MFSGPKKIVNKTEGNDLFYFLAFQKKKKGGFDQKVLNRKTNIVARNVKTMKSRFPSAFDVLRQG